KSSQLQGRSHEILFIQQSRSTATPTHGAVGQNSWCHTATNTNLIQIKYKEASHARSKTYRLEQFKD
ncbi:hypothetical protein ACRFHR_07045, partial [Klebsiella pneumoniae]